MISRALASLGPSAMAIATPLNPDQPILPPDTDASGGDEGEGLVEYEGMLVSASAAQRRRCCAHSYLILMCVKLSESANFCKAFADLLNMSWHARELTVHLCHSVWPDSCFYQGHTAPCVWHSVLRSQLVRHSVTHHYWL